MVITRRDKPISELVPLQSLRDLLPQQATSSVDTVRALRDGAEG